MLTAAAFFGVRLYRRRARRDPHPHPPRLSPDPGSTPSLGTAAEPRAAARTSSPPDGCASRKRAPAPRLAAAASALVLAVASLLGPAAPAAAEPLDLGPFPAKVVLYGVETDVGLDVSADVSTTRFGAHVAGDATASASAARLAANIEAIANGRLPFAAPAGPCVFKIVALSATSLSVSGNTGTFATTAQIETSGCPLSWGSVGLSVRFVPQATPAALGVKIVDVAVTTPFEWSFLGFLAGKSPSQLIAAAIRAQAATVKLAIPTLKNARAAFQGAAVDSKGDTLIFRLRSDVQADRQAIMDALTNLDQVKNLQVKYP
jgi:hypothetical protein